MARFQLVALIAWGACTNTKDDACADDEKIEAYGDVDGDGYGGGEPALVCALGADQVDDGADCDDADPSTFPGATELCDGADNACAGALPGDEADADLDGFRACDGDCDDTDSTSHPGAVELCDGVDNQCTGSVPADEADADLDGAMGCAGDCDDTNPDRYVGALETCDEVDNNCDGTIDEGFGTGALCDGVDLDAYREGVIACDATGGATACTDPNEDEQGTWEAPFAWPSDDIQTEAVHLVLLSNGQVLSMYHGSDVENPDGHSHFPNTYDAAALWDPASSVATAVPLAEGGDGNLFCSGHSHLADGRTFFTGGDVTGAQPARGETFTFTFDGLADPMEYGYYPWEYSGDMAGGARWYPTNVSLADGSVLITSGAVVLAPYEVNETTEVYLPSSGIFELRASQRFNYLYPWLHLLPDGRVLASGQEAQARVYDPVTDVWSNIGAPRDELRQYGSAVMLMIDGADPNPDGAALVVGGCEGRSSARCCLDDLVLENFPGDCDAPDPAPGSENWECFASAETLEGAVSGSPAWVPTGDMTYPRAHHLATLLPDGTVFVSGGEQNDCTAPPSGELYHPDARLFTVSAPYPTTYRGDYHTTALLLPDGRVLVTGGDTDSLDVDGPTAMIYRPPYYDLPCCPRPVITEAPALVRYGETLSVQVDTSEIDHFVLLRPGAVTHDFNQDQRGIELPVESVAADATGWVVEANVPASPEVVPPGYYLLFALSQDGVPSEAVYLKVTGEDCSTVVCDEPAAPSCGEGASVLQEYSACYEGTCQYATEVVACDAPTGGIAYCADGVCDWTCAEGYNVCGDACCLDPVVDVGLGESLTLLEGTYVLDSIHVSGELVLSGAVVLDVAEFVVEETGVVRCEADGATLAGEGAHGDGIFAGGGGGGGGAGGAGGEGGASWDIGSNPTPGGPAWLFLGADCATGGEGGDGGGGAFGGHGGSGGGAFVVSAATVVIDGLMHCDGAEGEPGIYDDGGGGGGAGGCVSILAGDLSVSSASLVSAQGGPGGDGGYCPPSICGGTYCGGGGGGGGGGGVFVSCDTCTMDDAGIDPSLFVDALSAIWDTDGGGGGANGTGSEGPCVPPADSGVAGSQGVLSSP